MSVLKTQTSVGTSSPTNRPAALSSIQKRAQLSENLMSLDVEQNHRVNTSTSPSLLESFPLQGVKRKATATVSVAPKTPCRLNRENTSSDMFVPNTPEHLQGSSLKERQTSSTAQREKSPPFVANLSTHSPVVA